jgi:xanthosine utilization system XapX-like protein
MYPTSNSTQNSTIGQGLLWAGRGTAAGLAAGVAWFMYSWQNVRYIHPATPAVYGLYGAVLGAIAGGVFGTAKEILCGSTIQSSPHARQFNMHLGNESDTDAEKMRKISRPYFS